MTAWLGHGRVRHDSLAWLVAVVALGGIVAVAWASRDTERLFVTLGTR